MQGLLFLEPPRALPLSSILSSPQSLLQPSSCSLAFIPPSLPSLRGLHWLYSISKDFPPPLPASAAVSASLGSKGKPVPPS
ncbi:hypothetical protein E2C01_074644 [Portunus trituberculatus]|uniref:Uncharacterized protein n=1 Tax=Portunus trituberculatus TaxID=210409 RepID=A0A5B7IGT8_PORTR|nr:hypothetical protein [Portunus trituberculatus]